MKNLFGLLQMMPGNELIKCRCVSIGSITEGSVYLIVSGAFGLFDTE